jgi:energy-coupling factor transport system ATP-binding protein
MVISIQGVDFTYPGGEAAALRDLNLEVPQGEFMALVGNNGSGKTSLCKLLTGLIPHFFQGDLIGSVKVAGLQVRETRVAELARHVGYVYQDFENQLLKPQVLEDVAFAPLNFGKADYRERAAETLDLLGLTYLRDRIIWELSGGEQHLVALAGALALRPEIVVVDEPTSSLDRSNRRQIVEMLGALERWVKTVIIATHDMEMVAEWAERIIVLRQGRVIADAPPETIFGDTGLVERARIRPPQVIALSNALDIHPVRLSVDAFIDYLMGDKAADGQKAEADVR